MRKLGAAMIVMVFAASCSMKAPASASATVEVVVAESAWGSLASQLAVGRIQVTSLVANPDADPHDYEPTADDARSLSTARYVIYNGVGYDEWARRIVESNDDPAQTVLDVGALVGASRGANPHRWYFPDDVSKVVDRIVDDYKQIDPADAGALDQRKAGFLTNDLRRYTAAIASIRANYAGVTVGASESLFTGVADAAGLVVATPRSFLTAVSEGVDPTAGDRSTVDAQIGTKSIKVFVVNPQNSTPDVARLVTAARRQGLPVVEFTETLVPRGATFVDWQLAQLRALSDALATAGRGG